MPERIVPSEGVTQKSVAAGFESGWTSRRREKEKHPIDGIGSLGVSYGSFELTMGRSAPGRPRR